MTANVQGSASNIGMAPSTNAGAGTSASKLPSLTGGANAGTTDPTTTGTAGTTGAGGTTAAAADPSALFQHGTWMGPLLTFGGGAAAIRGFTKAAAQASTKGTGLLKWGGIAAAIAGVGLTAIGFKAQGVKERGVQADAEQQQIIAAANAKLEETTNFAVTKIQTLQQELAQAKAAQQGSGTGGTNGTSGTGIGPGTDSTNTQNTNTQTTNTQTTNTQGGTWAASGLVGTTIDLTAGNSADGIAVAAAGTFQITENAGDANGYATLAEANTAARASMSTEYMGSRNTRWIVVEHGGRYYGAIATLVENGQANPLPTTQGNVVGWSALNHVEINGEPGWMAFSWNKESGVQTKVVPNGTTNVFGSDTSGGGAGIVGPTNTTSTTSNSGNVVDQTIAEVTGGGATTSTTSTTTRTPFDPASQIGRTFSINASNTTSGLLARGGALQIQSFVATSAGGFGTAEEADQAARQARATAGGGGQWQRWVTTQGSDGRFYVYQGSIVNRATAELQASPVHVFGHGFAEYFDGASSAWKAVAEQAAA